MARVFEYLMMSTRIGTHRKIRRLSEAERWAYLAGAVAIAAESPVRGVLLIEEGVPATIEDIAEQATSRVSVVKSMLPKAIELRLIVEDGEQCLVIRDFDEHNPAPRVDTTAAERQRRHRERVKVTNSHGTVTRDSHEPKRDGHADVTHSPPYPPLEGEVEVGKKRRLSDKKGKNGAGPDPDAPPDDLPEELHPALAQVKAALDRIHAERGGIPPTCRSVGMALVAFPRRDHLVAAGNLEHWLSHGRGRNRKVRDVVSYFRNWLREEPETTPPSGRPSRAARSSDLVDILPGNREETSGT